MHLDDIIKSINDYDFIDDILDADPNDLYDFGNKVEESLEFETEEILSYMSIEYTISDENHDH